MTLSELKKFCKKHKIQEIDQCIPDLKETKFWIAKKQEIIENILSKQNLISEYSVLSKNLNTFFINLKHNSDIFVILLNFEHFLEKGIVYVFLKGIQDQKINLDFEQQENLTQLLTNVYADFQIIKNIDWKKEGYDKFYTQKLKEFEAENQKFLQIKDLLKYLKNTKIETLEFFFKKAESLGSTAEKAQEKNSELYEALMQTKKKYERISDGIYKYIKNTLLIPQILFVQNQFEFPTDNLLYIGFEFREFFSDVENCLSIKITFEVNKNPMNNEVVFVKIRDSYSKLSRFMNEKLLQVYAEAYEQFTEMLNKLRYDPFFLEEIFKLDNIKFQVAQKESYKNIVNALEILEKI